MEPVLVLKYTLKADVASYLLEPVLLIALKVSVTADPAQTGVVETFVTEIVWPKEMFNRNKLTMATTIILRLISELSNTGK